MRELSPVEQEIYTKKLAKELKIAEGAIRMELLGNDNTEKPRQSVAAQKQPEAGTEITSIEKTLLKVMLTDDSYIEKAAAYPGIFQSGFAMKVYDILSEEYSRQQFVDIKKIMDNLEESEAEILQDILEQVLVGGSAPQVFDDCIRTWNRARLAKEEQRLIALLSLADEEDNQERILTLTDQLMKIQRERKNAQ